MAPGELQGILAKLPVTSDPRVLLGAGDDAGVYLLRDDLALVQTVDFFTPIVDDPFGFGAIAVANSLSDIYAMGATPLTALNVVCFPEKGPPGLEVLSEILAGGYAKAAEAGVAIIGGHTVDDREPKYGLAVTGVGRPSELFSHAGARPGDRLVLTKPIGTGILATALKADMEPPGTQERLIANCSALNDKAAVVARAFGARAVTDVTGFGLSLHALNVLRGSGVDGDLWLDRVPVLPGVRDCMAQGLIPAGSYANRSFAYPNMEVDAALTDDDVLLLNDAQTSGGLLIALPDGAAQEAVAALAERDIAAAVIGAIRPGNGRLHLLPGA